METMTKHEGLMAEIETEAKASLNSGKRYYLSDLGCSIGAIGASFIAAVLAATSHEPLWLTASVASMPGMFTALQRVIDLRGRGQWYLSRATHLRTLARSLRYEQVTIEGATKQFAEIEAEMDRRWTELIGTATTPTPLPNTMSDASK